MPLPPLVMPHVGKGPIDARGTMPAKVIEELDAALNDTLTVSIFVGGKEASPHRRKERAPPPTAALPHVAKQTAVGKPHSGGECLQAIGSDGRVTRPENTVSPTVLYGTPLPSAGTGEAVPTDAGSAPMKT